METHTTAAIGNDQVGRQAQKVPRATLEKTWGLYFYLIWLSASADEADAMLGQRREQEHEALTQMKTECALGSGLGYNPKP